MGKASSRKKIAKASRTAGRTRSPRNLGWWGLITGIVALGGGLVVVSRPDKVDAVPPRLTDHWHAAYGIDVCGEFLPGLSDAKADTSGIHSHGDGLIHIHPFSSRYTGTGANLGAFADTTGMTLTDTSLEVPGRDKLENGDKCPAGDGKASKDDKASKDGKVGEVQVMVWDSATDTTGSLLKGDFADYAPKDGSVVTIAFVPKGTKLEKPASAGSIPSDLPGATPPVTGDPTAGVPPVATESVPPAATESVPGETPTSSTP